MTRAPRRHPHATYLLFAFVIVITSCSKEVSQGGQRSKTPLVQQSTKHYDLPSPLGGKLLSCTLDTMTNTEALIYQTSMTLNQANIFYRQEMERLGWDLVELSTEVEGAFSCSKPKKCCVVSLRPTRQGMLNIMINLKKVA